MMPHTARAKFLLFVILVFGTAGAIFAAEGDLDPAFDGDGTVITDNGLSSESIWDLAIQPDGKIIVIGFSQDNSQTTKRVVIARYNPNGSIDSTFGTSGKVIVQLDFPEKLALQPDGKIVFVARVGASSSSDFYVARLNSDGSFDTTFNSTGVVNLDLRGTSDFARSVKIQPDGKIVVAGYSRRPASDTGFDHALVRFNPDGSLDQSFDGDGKAFTPITPEGVDFLGDILIQPDGKILTTGISVNQNGNSTFYLFLTVRFNADGSLDTTFDGDGKVFTQVGVYTEVGSVALQCDGKIIVGGTSTITSQPKAVLIRYNPNGSLDSSFANGGIMLSPWAHDARARDLSIQADNKIIVAGSLGTVKMSGMAVMRFNSNGSPDLTFSGDGWNFIPPSFLISSGAQAVAVQPDGKIVTGGGTFIPNNGTEFMIARFDASSRPANCSAIRREKVADFDGDGRTDLSVFRNGTWFINTSSANNPNSFYSVQFGLTTDKLTPADFDGDGRTDIAVFRDGVWYWLNSSNGNFNAYQFGIAGDIPVPFDYTGDGRAEVAVYRSGYWYILNLANNQFQVVQFGISSDKPVPADYDGDGKTDVAVYRDGVWYLLRSQLGFAVVQFGLASDKPVVGDYDGDSKADQAVYRSGVWYVLGSTQGFYAVQFGISSDIPAAADYDGDGKTDIAVYRDGIWYLLRSQQGFGAVQFGTTNDRPIPAAFVP